MKLVKFRIENYRSILDSSEILLSNYNAIIGKNNEGKTNIVYALQLAFSCLDSLVVRRSRFASRSIGAYSFSLDYPVCLQEKSEKYLEKHPTRFTLFFESDIDELQKVKKEYGIWLGNNFGLEISICKNNSISYKFLRKRFNDNADKSRGIILMISKFIPCTIIPTVRTEEQSQDIINDIIYRKLDGSLSADPDYIAALDVIRSKEAGVLYQIGNDILPTLQKFIPAIKQIKLTPTYSRLYRRGTGFDNFEIDDGVNTSFDSKGDGIKSLLQIALSKFNAANNNGLLIVEEPEAHLHSGAIHELNDVFQSISEQQQVIITSHNPIFVNTNDVKSNIIVDNHSCSQAKSLKQIREILGIEIADSLFLSDFVILVEGTSDKNLFRYLFEKLDETGKIKKLLESKKIIIQECGGASKIEVYMNHFKNMLINYFAIYDNDDAGIKALNSANNKKLLENGNYFKLIGKDEKTELEDLVKFDFSCEFLKTKYNVDISACKNLDLTWSDKVEKVFKNSGRDYDDFLEEKIKADLVEEIKKNSIQDVISPIEIEHIKSMISSILLYYKNTR